MSARHLPPLSSLRPFEAAARLGGFTRAATELNLSQAAVSQQIRNLEQWLGCRLFERRNRAAILTPEGRAFAQTVGDALHGIGTHAARLRGERDAREVILFAQLCEAYYWVLPRLGRFSGIAPDVHVNVVASPVPLAEFDGEFDLALQTSARAAGDHRRLLTVADEVFPLCSPRLLADVGDGMDLDTLARQPLLHHQRHPQDWLDWDDWFAAVGSRHRPGFEGAVFEDYLFMIQAAVEGRGVTLGWRRTMTGLIDAGALVRPVPESVELSDGLSVYARGSGEPRRETRAVLDWLRTELEA